MSAAPEVFVSFVQLPEFVHRNGAERELRICASGCPGTETACAWLDWACVRAVAVEWGIDVLSTAGQQPPARLREVALASSALDNLDAHQIHFGAIDLISDILALKLFRAYGVPDSVAKAFLAHFSSDLAVDLEQPDFSGDSIFQSEVHDPTLLNPNLFNPDLVLILLQNLHRQ